MIGALTWWLWGVSLAMAYTTPSSSGTCAACHEAEFDRHADSRHAKAWSNALFRSEYDAHPKAWCVRCHAPAVPEALRDKPTLVGVLAAEGVGCAACHVRDGRIVSKRRSPLSIHDTVIDEALGAARDCARCHQFQFPLLDELGRLVQYTDEPMQNTIAEHRHSGSDDSCASCHMDQGDHEFPGSHYRDMLERAVRVTACRRGKYIEVTLRNRGASHNVPSGGVHRHIALRVWRSSSPGRLHELVLGRNFVGRRGGGKRKTRDTTLPPGASRRLRIKLSALGGAATEPINSDLRYVYSAPVEPGKNATKVDQSPEAPLPIWTLRASAFELPRCKNGR